MQLGSLPPKIGAASDGIVATDLDWTLIEKKVDQVKQMQLITIIALAFVVLLLLKNGKN
jgi:hypothetical protein